MRIKHEEFCELWLLTILLSLVCLSGCNRSAVKNEKESPQVEDLAADEILQRMIDAYIGAEGYEDNAKLRVTFGKGDSREEDFAIAFHRPAKIHIKAYDIELASDGETLRYGMSDEQAAQLDNQSVIRPAPEKLDLEELLSLDPILYDLMRGIAGHPVQTELLMSENPLQPFFDEAVTMTRLENEQFSERECYRVKVSTEQGDFTLWVDCHEFILRRFDYPAATFLGPLIASPDIGGLELAAEFHDAKFKVPSDSRFVLDRPKNAKFVAEFVLPPALLPTDLYGERPKKFHFTGLDSDEVTQESLNGQITALLWFNLSPASPPNLQDFAAVQREFESDERVKLLAVCTDPSTSIGNDDLAEQLAAWKTDVVTVRDLLPCGQSLFGITALPTLLVLDARGTVQYFRVLDRPVIKEELPATIRRLLNGDDLALEARQWHREQVVDYNQRLELASATDKTPDFLPLPEAKLPSRTSPKHFQLSEAWNNGEFKAAGNLLAVASEDGPGIFALDGFQTVVEIDQQGMIVKRHTLDLPKQAAVTYLRTATRKDGERVFLLSEVQGRQVHVFDDSWNRLFSFPDISESHDGIRDAQFADLDGDNEPEIYIAYNDLLGIQQVDFNGRRTGGNRTLPKVTSITVSNAANDGKPGLLVTDELGRIVPIGSDLQYGRSISVRPFAILRLVRATFASPAPTNLCAIATNDGHNLFATGLDEELGLAWTYQLSSGVFNRVEGMSSGTFFKGSENLWILSRPDGAIHFKAADGEFEDMFYFGKPVTGVTTATVGTNTLLILSAENSVSAWRLSKAD